VTDLELFSDLMANLRKEAGHYRRLRQLGEEQKALLIAGDMQPLPENVRASEREVFALGPLNTSRTQAIEHLGRQLGIAGASLTALSDRAPLDMKPAFREAVHEVVQAAKELDEVNRGNEKLLENAVNYVSFTLNALSDGGKPKSTYSPAALRSTAPNTQAASMLNRVV
jgi:hypothetical protein